MNWFERHRIVVPFDYSVECHAAIRVALEISDQSDYVYILHVINELPANDPFVKWEENLQEKRKRHAAEQLAQELREQRLGDAHIEIGVGKPADTIAEFARRIDAGLIILPSHTRAGIARALLGSVAERVVRLATCPVLTLKDHQPD